MSSFVVAVLLLATGASFTELTVIEIVALFDTSYYRLLCKSDWVALPAEVQYRCKVTTPALFTVIRSPATVNVVWIPAVDGPNLLYINGAVNIPCRW
jgi:cupin superfamily acireductone dioxygenase involved in methionine salvage